MRATRRLQRQITALNLGAVGKLAFVVGASVALWALIFRGAAIAFGAAP